MSAEHDDHVMPASSSVAGDGAGDRSLLTSPEESVFEKASPAPASILSDTANLAQNEETEEKDMHHDKKLRTMDSNDPDAEPVYPRMITKVLVGVGLALAVFLVTSPLSSLRVVANVIRYRWIRLLWQLLFQSYRITLKH